MTKITLPPLPEPSNYPSAIEMLRARDIEVVRVVLEAAARECESRSRYHPVDTPIERAMLAESKYCAYDIRALEIKHE